MGTSTFKMRWYNGFHNVSRLKAVPRMFLLGISTRKTILVHQAHLSRSVPISSDSQWDDSSNPNVFWSAFAHTCSIKPMGFRKLMHSSVVLRETSRTTLDR